jgi:hypothetical protein
MGFKRWKPDDIDLLCMDWAKERRKIHGIILGTKFEPRERLGKLRSTLSQTPGASHGSFNQDFPEVYTGMNLIVHRAFCGMRGEWREIMNAHYVHREDPVKVKAHKLGISVHDYWERLGRMKAFLSGVIFIRSDDQSLSSVSNPTLPTQNMLAG